MKSLKELWAGRTFKCMDTGESFTIPEDVKKKEFYPVGNGFIDIGDGYYCRFGGNMHEVFEDSEKKKKKGD